MSWLHTVREAISPTYKSRVRSSILLKLTVHRRLVIKKARLPRWGGVLHSGPLTLAFTPGRVSRVLNFCLISGWHAYSLVNPFQKDESYLVKGLNWWKIPCIDFGVTKKKKLLLNRMSSGPEQLQWNFKEDDRIKQLLYPFYYQMISKR